MFNKKRIWAMFALSFLAFSCSENSEVINEQENFAEVIPNQYIIVFADDAIPTGRALEPTFVDRSEKIRYSAARRI